MKNVTHSPGRHFDLPATNTGCSQSAVPCYAKQFDAGHVVGTADWALTGFLGQQLAVTNQLGWPSVVIPLSLPQSLCAYLSATVCVCVLSLLLFLGRSK